MSGIVLIPKYDNTEATVGPGGAKVSAATRSDSARIANDSGHRAVVVSPGFPNRFGQLRQTQSTKSLKGKSMAESILVLRYA